MADHDFENALDIVDILVRISRHSRGSFDRILEEGVWRIYKGVQNLAFPTLEQTDPELKRKKGVNTATIKDQISLLPKQLFLTPQQQAEGRKRRLALDKSISSSTR
jgi:hypothetical protein